jgi:aminoglycoside phosphotransferase (APT) family kinase protein
MSRPQPALEPAWPPALVAQLRQTHGAPTGIEQLGGMSGGRVWRVRCATASLIVKLSASPAEARFYEQVAEPLRAAGVPSPRMEWALHEPDAHWLILEDIPAPLPVQTPATWSPDARVIAILARLHAVTRANPPNLQDAQPQAWTDAMTSSALTFFSPEVAATLALRLRQLRQASQPIFTPWCWVSGDPNPLNWGQRDDGSPVLFDWELFGPGTPAIDLAIIIPGLGHAEQYAETAECYVEHWARQSAALPWTSAVLARDIALAKIASVVRLLAAHADGSARVNDELVTWLIDQAPARIDTLAYHARA